MDSEMFDVDVAVVGAGLAGLSAARKLAGTGKTVVVLEARDRVAGRTKGGFLSNGVPVEMGGPWVGPTQDVVLELIDELGLETFLSFDQGEALTVFDDNVVRHADKSYDLPPDSAEEMNRLWEQLEALASTVVTEKPWESEDAHELDRQTLDSWLVRNSEDSLARGFFRVLVPAPFSAESPELSLLHFLFYIKSGTSLDSLMNVTGGAQEARVVGGTHLISERMAAALGDAVQLNSVVRTVRQDASSVLVEYEGGSITAEHVIVAVPQTMAGRIRYMPPLPALRDGLTQQMPAGAVIKFQVGYDTPFWREEGLTGSVLSFDDAFNVVLDNSPQDGSCGVLVGFLEGSHARSASAMNVADRHRIVIDALVKYFGPKAAEPFDIVEQDWTTEEFTRGCYGGRLGAGAWTQYGDALSEPVGRTHWAGAETSSIWNGYMDGAIRSGSRAAGQPRKSSAKRDERGNLVSTLRAERE